MEQIITGAHLSDRFRLRSRVRGGVRRGCGTPISADRDARLWLGSPIRSDQVWIPDNRTN
jgi:hypothetical protein